MSKFYLSFDRMIDKLFFRCLNERTVSIQRFRDKGESFMSIAIVTDSTAYLTDEFVRKHDITVLPLTITFSDGSYLDNIDISTDAFYDKMATLDEIPTSSQPAPGIVKEAFERLAKTHDEIIAITLSKGISGTYQTFTMIGNQVAEDTGVRVKVYNSGISLVGQAFYVYEAVRLRDLGYTAMDILPKLDALKCTTDAYFSVDNLGHLAKGGRINPGAASIGNLLQVKPILHFDDGLINVFEKVRTHKKTVRRITELFEESYQKNPQLRVAIVGDDATPQVQSLVTYFKTVHPDLLLERTPVGPVIGTHLGPNAYALAWCEDTTKSI